MELKLDETKTMVKRYNEAKRKASELESVSSSLRKDLKRIKTEVKAMAGVIQPTVKETEKAVSNTDYEF